MAISLTINGKEASLKKGSSIEYVSENRIFTDADDYSPETTGLLGVLMWAAPNTGLGWCPWNKKEKTAENLPSGYVSSDCSSGYLDSNQGLPAPKADLYNNNSLINNILNFLCREVARLIARRLFIGGEFFS